MTLDGFYSHFKDDIDQKGFEMPFKFGTYKSWTNITAKNGIVTRARSRGRRWSRITRTTRAPSNIRSGWNTLWDGHNGWKALADLSWSRTDRTEHRIETTAGVYVWEKPVSATCLLGTGCATVSFTNTDHGPEYVSNYNGANPALVLTDVEGWSGGSFVQAGYDKVRSTKDDLKEARGEIEREIGSFIKSIKLGVDYTNHDKTLGQIEGFLAPPVGQTQAAIPSSTCSSPSRLIAGSAQSCHGTRGQSATRASCAISTTRSRTAATMSKKRCGCRTSWRRSMPSSAPRP